MQMKAGNSTRALMDRYADYYLQVLLKEKILTDITEAILTWHFLFDFGNRVNYHSSRAQEDRD